MCGVPQVYVGKLFKIINNSYLDITEQSISGQVPCQTPFFLAKFLKLVPQMVESCCHWKSKDKHINFNM